MEAQRADQHVVDIDEAGEHAPLSRTHLLLLIACSIVITLDGMESAVLGKVAPAISTAFGTSSTSLAFIFLLQQIGLVFGALVVSPIADRYGRKTLTLWSVAAFGIFTLGTVWAQSMLQVAILRGLASIFLAAAIPSVSALLAEFAPPRRRALFMTLAFTGFATGNAVSSGSSSSSSSRWDGAASSC